MLVKLEIVQGTKFMEKLVTDLIIAREQCGEVPIARGFIKVPSEKNCNLHDFRYEEFSEKIFPGIVASRIVGKQCIEPKPPFSWVIGQSKKTKNNFKIKILGQKSLSRTDLQVHFTKKVCPKCKQKIKGEVITLNPTNPVEIHSFPNLENPSLWGLVILYYREPLCHSTCKTQLGYLISRRRLSFFNTPGVFTKEYWYNLFPKSKIFGAVLENLKSERGKDVAKPILVLSEVPELKMV